MCTCEKPPLGLFPKYLWDEARLQEIDKAIIRYTDRIKEIPIEWIEERNELIKTLYKEE